MFYFLYIIFICIGCLRAGYMYKEQIEKEKEKAGYVLLLNCLIYGFFGWIFSLKYYIKIYNKKCEKCIKFKNNKCIKSGKFCSKKAKACINFENI